MPCDRYKDPDYKVKWARNFRKEHPEEWKERQTRYYENSKEQVIARTAARTKRIAGTEKYKESRRKSWIKIKYGLTIEEYNEMHRAQDGLCAICGKQEITRWRRLAVDHDHKSGKVRGLLCFQCNAMLAYFEDGNWVYRASEYLKKYGQG